MEKVCCRCKELKDTSDFGKLHCSKDGFQYSCKLCKKKYREENKDKIYAKQRQFYHDNKDKLLKSQKHYYETNKDIISKKNKIYRDTNKVKVNLTDKIYRDKNKEKLAIKRREYRLSNSDRLKECDKYYYINNKDRIVSYRSSPAKYVLYYDKLTIDEFPRLSYDGLSLEVKCKYCGKYFIPSINKVNNRIGSLSGNQKYLGDRFLYCSNGCKSSCPIYGQMKYPKGFKKATSREVNPLLRQMCFERDSWKCQICEKSVEEITLHCHHIEGYTQNPLLGNDITNVITLCKEHHKEVHKLPGCSYNKLQCKSESDIHAL